MSAHGHTGEDHLSERAQLLLHRVSGSLLLLAAVLVATRV